MVTLVVLLTTMVVMVFYICIFPHIYYQKDILWSGFHLFFSHWLLMNIVFNYVMAAFTNPGHPSQVFIFFIIYVILKNKLCFFLNALLNYLRELYILLFFKQILKNYFSTAFGKFFLNFLIICPLNYICVLSLDILLVPIEKLCIIYKRFIVKIIDVTIKTNAAQLLKNINKKRLY